MGVSKVNLGEETLVDLTSDTVNPNNLLKGATAHGADGELVDGGVVAAPLTTSLAVTQSGVSALDGSVGKVLNDKGAQMSVYKGEDGNLHFRDWNGADTVLNFINNVAPSYIGNWSFSNGSISISYKSESNCIFLIYGFIKILSYTDKNYIRVVSNLDFNVLFKGFPGTIEIIIGFVELKAGDNLSIVIDRSGYPLEYGAAYGVKY